MSMLLFFAGSRIQLQPPGSQAGLSFPTESYCGRLLNCHRISTTTTRQRHCRDTNPLSDAGIDRTCPASRDRWRWSGGRTEDPVHNRRTRRHRYHGSITATAAGASTVNPTRHAKSAAGCARIDSNNFAVSVFFE